MAFDERLAERVRELLVDEEGITEKRMFGGLGFLLNGNLAVSASGRGGLLVRIDPDEFDSLLAPPQVEMMEMRGRRMTGWLIVTSEAITTKSDLVSWGRRGLDYAASLPSK
jgi:TfoX/Sxy family transcriptional regulator of competence genes